MASNYTPFDPSRPDGTVDDGPDYETFIKSNAYVLWTGLAIGLMPGLALTCSGGTAAKPTQFLLSDGSNQRVKGIVTWTGDYITQIVWSFSQDAGANYAATTVTVALTYDGSGNLTGTTGAGGFLAFVAMLLGKHAALLARVVAIEAFDATLGTMAFQDATSVAITGGTMKGTVIGGTGAGEAQLAYLIASRENWTDLGSGTPANTFTIDMAAGGCFKCTVGNNFIIAVTNQPPNGKAQKVVLEIYGALGFTSTLPSGYDWGGAGEPMWTAGPDLVTLYCRSHASTPVKRAMLSSYGA